MPHVTHMPPEAEILTLLQRSCTPAGAQNRCNCGVYVTASETPRLSLPLLWDAQTGVAGQPHVVPPKWEITTQSRWLTRLLQPFHLLSVDQLKLANDDHEQLLKHHPNDEYRFTCLRNTLGDPPFVFRNDTGLETALTQAFNQPAGIKFSDPPLRVENGSRVFSDDTVLWLSDREANSAERPHHLLVGDLSLLLGRRGWAVHPGFNLAAGAGGDDDNVPTDVGRPDITALPPAELAPLWPIEVERSPEDASSKRRASQYFNRTRLNLDHLDLTGWQEPRASFNWLGMGWLINGSPLPEGKNSKPKRRDSRIADAFIHAWQQQDKAKTALDLIVVVRAVQMAEVLQLCAGERRQWLADHIDTGDLSPLKAMSYLSAVERRSLVAPLSDAIEAMTVAVTDTAGSPRQMNLDNVLTAAHQLGISGDGRSIKLPKRDGRGRPRFGGKFDLSSVEMMLSGTVQKSRQIEGSNHHELTVALTVPAWWLPWSRRTLDLLSLPVVIPEELWVDCEVGNQVCLRTFAPTGSVIIANLTPQLLTAPTTLR